MEEDEEDSVSHLFPVIMPKEFIYPTDPFPEHANKVPRQTKVLVDRLFYPIVAEIKSAGEVPAKKPLPKYYYSAAQNHDTSRKGNKSKKGKKGKKG